MAETYERFRFSEEDLLRRGVKAAHHTSVASTYHIHTHNTYEMFVVVKGRAIHAVNGATQLLTEGSFVLIRPQDVHRYEVYQQDNLEFFNLHLPETVFRRLCSYLQLDRSRFDLPVLPPHCVLPPEQLRQVRDKILAVRDPDTGIISSRDAMVLYPDLIWYFLSAPTSEAVLPQWLSALLREMDCRENIAAGLPRLLSCSHVSQEHLTRSFHRYLGITPTRFINQKRLAYAAELLKTTDLPVLEISGRCGFNSQSRFYRLFSDWYGCPPLAYRGSPAGRMPLL